MSSSALLASLMQAGIPARQAWQLAGDINNHDLLSVWEFAMQTGAPIVDAMRELSLQEAATQAQELELEQAMALPKATKNLLLWLPLFGLMISQAFGLEPFAAFSNPLGVVAVLLAIGLLIYGDKKASAMISRLKKPNSNSLQLLLFAMGLKAGLSVNQTQKYFSQTSEAISEIGNLLDISFQSGAPIADLFLVKAKDNRLRATSEAIAQARALSVRLLIPLGLTTLPAFLLLTVVPVMISQITR